MSFFDQLKRKSADPRTLRSRQVTMLREALAANAREDAHLSPEDARRWQSFLPELLAALERYSAEPDQPVDASVRFFLTEDRMFAYACLLPPVDGGNDMQLDGFGRELGYSGICAGLDQESALTALAKRRYLHIFPVARGVPPKDGEDGVREDLYPHRSVYVIDEREGKVASFTVDPPVSLVRCGDTVCRVRPAAAGIDGTDVTGRVLPARDGTPAELPIGINLALSEDGLRVEATENGAVYRKDDGVIFVQTAVVRTETLKQDDNLVWMAFIQGDIPEGIKVKSTSNVLVMGECRGAEVTSNGSVRVLKGISGGCKIQAKGQVLAPVIRDSCVKAGKAVFAEEITDSDVSSGECVYVLGGEGVIRGGTVRAAEQVECIRIGSPDGGNNQFFVGFSPELEEEIDRLSAELSEAQETLEKLRKSILKLRQGGKSLSIEKRTLLGQLTEQRNLYEERTAAIDLELQEARNKFRVNRTGKVLCREMYPLTVVHIGDRSQEFAYPETNCNIRIYGGQIVSK